MTDKPTKPGFYWAWWNDFKRPDLPYPVYVLSGLDSVLVHAEARHQPIDDFTFLPPVEPLTPPEIAKETKP